MRIKCAVWKLSPKTFGPWEAFLAWYLPGPEGEERMICKNFSDQAKLAAGKAQTLAMGKRRKQGTEALFGAVFGISSGKHSIDHNLLIIQTRNNTWTIKEILKRIVCFQLKCCCWMRLSRQQHISWERNVVEVISRLLLFVQILSR